MPCIQTSSPDAAEVSPASHHDNIQVIVGNLYGLSQSNYPTFIQRHNNGYLSPIGRNVTDSYHRLYRKEEKRGTKSNMIVAFIFQGNNLEKDLEKV